MRASPEVLERLAQVLRMSDDERAYAFALSGYGVPLESPDESVTDGLRQLVEAMQPIPAYVRNTRFDILAGTRPSPICSWTTASWRRTSAIRCG